MSTLPDFNFGPLRAGGAASEVDPTFDFFSPPLVHPRSFSSTVSPNQLIAQHVAQHPAWEQATKWDNYQNWGYNIHVPRQEFPFEYQTSSSSFSSDLLPISSASTSRSSSVSLAGLPTPISAISPLFPTTINLSGEFLYNPFPFFNPADLPPDVDATPKPAPSPTHTRTPSPNVSPKTVAMSSRGRKRLIPTSFAEPEDQDSQEYVPGKKTFPKKKAAKHMPSDDEDDDEDDGSDSGRSDISNKPARRGGKSAMDKKERRKATNRASAKAFRARRKNLLTDIQSQISERDKEISSLHSLISRLKDEKQKIFASGGGN